MRICMKKDFNKLALQTSIFKGHVSWYYFYLKTEKIAHVLILLRQRSASPTPLFELLVLRATELPSALLRVATGETDEKQLTAQIFSILTLLRLLTTQGEIGKDNSVILVQEYEAAIEKIGEESREFELVISPDQLAIALPKTQSYSRALPTPLGFPNADIKDIYKGHIKNQRKGHPLSSKRQETGGDRTSTILNIVRDNIGISIKGISAIVRDCSEKTIQRELSVLISQGFVVKEGERRWSIYKPTPTS